MVFGRSSNAVVVLKQGEAAPGCRQHGRHLIAPRGICNTLQTLAVRERQREDDVGRPQVVFQHAIHVLVVRPRRVIPAPVGKVENIRYEYSNSNINTK